MVVIGHSMGGCISRLLHLKGAESEHIVPSDHSAHQNPQAIAAVLKILKDSAGR
jgi:triacylglycerol esterase/lipase EstA (alpha/beta hydrolase family)